MKEKNICPKCTGNGYRTIWKDADQKEKVTIQCSYCGSEGEISNEDEIYFKFLKRFYKGEKYE